MAIKAKHHSYILTYVMDVKSAKELQKILNLLRKQGVRAAKIGKETLEIELFEGFQPVDRARKARNAAATSTSDNISTEEMTPEQILFYSTQNFDGAQG